jgi:phospholipid transport system substrate-binding protein
VTLCTARPLGSAARLALALLLALAPSAALATDTALATIERFHAGLLDVMKRATELGYEGRYRVLEPIVGRNFDTPFMASKSVGRYWKEMGEADHQRLVQTFARFTTANYAGRFDGWSGQSFETLREEPSLHDTMLVYSRISEPAGEVVEINYRLRQVDAVWKIIDVYLNGTVSEVALRRSEYSSILGRSGVDGLISALEEKIQELAQSKPAEPGVGAGRALGPRPDA